MSNCKPMTMSDSCTNRVEEMKSHRKRLKSQIKSFEVLKKSMVDFLSGDMGYEVSREPLITTVGSAELGILRGQRELCDVEEQIRHAKKAEKSQRKSKKKSKKK